MAKVDWKDGQSGFLESGQGNLEYACYGPSPEKAPTIIMLHEGLGAAGTWKDFPKHLQQKTGMGVFVYSRLGYGKSGKVDVPRPLDYMTREAVEILPVVLDAVDVKSAVLLGHSDGATIAAIYAGSVIDHRIRGLVLIAPHFFCEDLSIEGIEQAKVAYESGDLKQRLARYHEHPDIAFYGWNRAWLDPRFRDWNVADVIDYLRIPVLAIQGRDDQYGTLAQIEEIESRIYAPLDVEIIDQCRHSPHSEKPEETLAAVAEFTKRLTRIEREEVKLA